MESLRAAVDRVCIDDEATLNARFSACYDELRKLAHSRLWANNAVGRYHTTSLVHESYLRLVNAKTFEMPERRQFFAYASRVMRSIIVDLIREQNADRRGGGHAPVTLDTDIADLTPRANDAEAVSDAVKDLDKMYPELARLVEMRFFGGMTEPEIAEVLGISERTVRREWDKARAILLVLLEDAG